MDNNNYDFFFWLSVMSNWCQLESYQMNQKQLSNDDLMKHLQKQDNVLEKQNQMLDEQTTQYLKTIIKQNQPSISVINFFTCTYKFNITNF